MLYLLVIWKKCNERPEYKWFCSWDLVGAFNGGNTCPGSLGIGKVESWERDFQKERTVSAMI